MGNAYLDKLNDERDQLAAQSRAITDGALREDRDVTDDEFRAVEGMLEQVKSLEKRMAPVQDLEIRQANQDKARAEITRAVKAGPSSSSQGLDYYRGDVGRYLADWGAKVRDPSAAARLARAHSEYRVVADQKLADNPGIVPVPVLGPLVGTLPTARPFIDSVTNRAMPAGGSTFNRPVITQHAAVGLQATEKTQLSSQKLVIGSVPVTKKTYGGTLDISFQDRDWTDPAILAIAVDDLRGLYAQETDNAAADAMLAATTGTFVLADAAAEGPARAAIMTASSQIYANVKARPDTVWMSTDEYAKWGAMTTSVGLPSFPGLGADATTVGGNLMGLRVVVDPNFAAKTMIIGASSFVEHYETVGGLLAVTEPTILGYTVAYYGYVADLLLQVGAALKRSAT